MPRISTRDQQQLYVRVIGQGQPVLMLHGLGMQSSQWLPFILPFIRHFKFYMPDFRGSGKSASIRFNQIDVFENHAQDIEDVIRHFDLKNFDLVGYSLGATTALHLQRSPEFNRVRRYLHIDQSPCVGNRADWTYGLFGEQQAALFSGFQQLLDVISPFENHLSLSQLPLEVRLQASALLGGIFEKMLGKPLIRQIFKLSAYWPVLMPYVVSLSRLEDIRLYLESYMRGQHDYRQVLGHWQVPATVFIGKKSPLYHANGQRLVAEKMQPSTVVEFEKSGHGLLLDEPVKFIRELRHFLA
ncbi:alpha/beta fold hydrolase [Alkanindiges sp. WGS2144]|uniref:alpha/beta fold hydrolase n=1 Tax=Alkanindiges sp. WGS2144 TaxID=3366808 RepID=UPI0037531066